MKKNLNILLSILFLFILCAIGCSNSSMEGDSDAPGKTTAIPDSDESGKPTAIPDSSESGKPTAIPDSSESGKPTAIPDSSESGKPTAIPDSDAPADSSTDNTDNDSIPEDTTREVSELSFFIKDEDGVPCANVRLSVCRDDMCSLLVTDEDGMAVYPLDKSASEGTEGTSEGNEDVYHVTIISVPEGLTAGEREFTVSKESPETTIILHNP